MQVDHVIPVGAMRRHRLLRAHLKGGVNDISNLVPSCRKCNLKKASKTGLHYRIRARLGSHEGYWAFRHITHAILVLALAVLVCYGVRHPSETLHLWQVCRKQIASLVAELWKEIGGPRSL